MPMFRKKPVVIEARYLDPDGEAEDWNTILKWCSGRASQNMEWGPHIEIDTLEGTHAALPGDWIIRGVAGEFYPCKPDIFEATYEPQETPYE